MNANAFLIYTFIASVYMIVFAVAYRLFFARRTDFKFNRWLIMSMFLLSFLLPVLTQYISDSGFEATVRNEKIISTKKVVNISASTTEIISAIYLCGAAFMLLFTLFSWMRLAIMVRKGERIKGAGHTLVITDTGHAPFSWMRYIVVSRSDMNNDKYMIMNHELSHVNAGHWMDMLIVQAATILMWYNPAVWFMRAEIRAVHEYQADSEVIASGTSSTEYRMMLLRRAYGKTFTLATESINSSPIKNRLRMMQREGHHTPRLMLALLLPFIAGVVAVMSIPSVNLTMRVIEKSRVLVVDKNSGPTIFVNGKQIDKNEMNKINPNDIKNISVNRTDDVIDITLK